MSTRVRAWLADRESLAFLGCIVLHLLPIWWFDHFPTQDGPSHVANASVLRDYGRPDRGLLREYYSLNWWPNPNWLGHFVMAALMAVMPPVAAEKVLLTGYVVGLPLAVRYALGALDPASRPLAFLSFPFVYNYALHMGFYNFSLSLPLFFLTVGYWLAHGGRLGLRQAGVLQLLSLLLYFSHPLGLGAAWLAIAVLGLHGLAVELIERRREKALSPVVLGGSFRARVLAPGFAASPAAVLAALYLLEGRPGSAAPFRPDLAARLDRLVRLEPLLSHTPSERLPAMALAGLFGAALLYAMLRRLRSRDLPRRDTLLLVAVVYLVVYLMLPDAMAGGGFILSRLGLFPYFGLILWLGAQTFSPWARRAVGWGAAVIACAFLALRVPSYARLDAYLGEYLSVARHVEPNTTLLPISFACWGAGLEGEALSWRIAVFLHASGYVAAGRGVVVFDNYEANTDLFPTRFRPRVNPYTHIGSERCGGYHAEAPDFLTYPERTGGRLDYVLVWGLRDEHRTLPYARSVLRQLEAGYELIYVSPEGGLARLYRRREAGRGGRDVAPALRPGAGPGENSLDAQSAGVSAAAGAGGGGGPVRPIQAASRGGGAPFVRHARATPNAGPCCAVPASSVLFSRRETNRMLLTLTPNPSVDLLFEADRLAWDDANRVDAPRRRPGGQGINVARAVRVLGGRAVAVAPLGGRVGREVEEALEAEGTPLRRVGAAGETRVFVGVVERATGRSLLVNPRGPTLSEAEYRALEEAVVEALEAERPAWLACCGSVPPGVPPDLYARLGRFARERGVRFVPDCDGELLRLAASAGCDLLVPNRHEAGRLLGAPVDDVASAIRAAEALLRFGPAFAAITLGEEGAVAATAGGIWHAAGPRIREGSAVGAGDAFLAALLVALEGGAEPPEALRAGVGAGAAVLLSRGSELLRREDAEAVAREVRVRRVG